MQIYCLKCKKQIEAQEVEQVNTSTKPRIAGKCPICGNKVSRVGTLPPLISETVEITSTPIPNLVSVGLPIPLGNLTATSTFEVGGRFYNIESIEKANVLVTQLSSGLQIMMGTATMVKRAQ